MWLNESEVRVWKAGETAPTGVYLRLDNRSYQRVVLLHEGPLPASFDGQVALYRAAPLLPGRDSAGAAHRPGGSGW